MKYQVEIVKNVPYVEGGRAGGLLLLRRARGGRYQKGGQEEKLCNSHFVNHLMPQRYIFFPSGRLPKSQRIAIFA